MRTGSRRDARNYPGVFALLIAGLVLAPQTSRATPSPVQTVGYAAPQVRPDPLLADVTPLRAQDMSIQIADGHRQLRFTAGLANIGRGPLEVRPDHRRRCGPAERHASQVIYRDVDDNQRFLRHVDIFKTLRSAGCMAFHPLHDHWHFEAASRYRVYRPDRERDAIVRSRKTSFCLRDSERVPLRLGAFNKPLYYSNCARDTPQGISTGWVDVYASYLPGQALRVPDRLPNGVYCLGIRVDPLDELWESNETNNDSARAFRLYRDRVEPVQSKPCTSAR